MTKISVIRYLAILTVLSTSEGITSKALAAEPPAAPARALTSYAFTAIADDAATGVEYSLVTVIFVSGEPITAVAKPISEASKGALREARIGPQRRILGDAKGVSADGFQIGARELIDITLLMRTEQIEVYQLDYSDGSQQIMTVNLDSGQVTFGPIVGGN